MTKRDLSNIPPGRTICSVCNIEKDNTEFSFYKERKTSNGFRLMTNTNCQSCQKVRGKERSSIKKKFKNLKQPPIGSPCELCEKPVYKNWQLDHCHETGKFRGWICKGCNTGMGGLGDTEESLVKALEYLRRAKVDGNRSQQNILFGQSNNLEKFTCE